MASKDHDFLRALRREPVTRRPVWIMRQAGRYLPEYRATRERAGSFLQLMQTPELAAEVTLQPLRRYDLDAAIIFADILTIPDAMGLGLSFVAGEGPRFERTLRRKSEVDALPAPDPERDLGYVLDSIRTVARELAGSKPLIGFSGGPWTLAAYMLEGRSGGGEFKRARGALHSDPGLGRAVTARLVPAIADYLAAQARAGADALMIFASWAGLLTPDGFRRYCQEPLAEIVERLKADPDARGKPLIVFPKGAHQHAADLSRLGMDALGLDWTASLGEVRQTTEGRVALQGNLDPAALVAPEPQLRAAVRAVIDDYGQGPGHVFNLGHGITPDIDPDQLAIVIDEIHKSAV